MPIVVAHSPILAIANAAQQVGAYNTNRQNAADQRLASNDQFQRDQFAQQLLEAQKNRDQQTALSQQQFQQQQQLSRQNQDADLMRQTLGDQNSMNSMLLHDALGDQSTQDQQAFDLKKLGIEGQQAQDLARTRAQMTGANDLAVQDLRNQPKLMAQQDQDTTEGLIHRMVDRGDITPAKGDQAIVNLRSGNHAPLNGELMSDFVQRLAAKTDASAYLQNNNNRARADLSASNQKAIDDRQDKSLAATTQRRQATDAAAADRRAATAANKAAEDEMRHRQELYRAKAESLDSQIAAQKVQLANYQRKRKDLSPELQRKMIDSTKQGLMNLYGQKGVLADELAASKEEYLASVHSGKAAAAAAADTGSPAPDPAAEDPRWPTQAGSQDENQAARSAQRPDGIPQNIGTEDEYNALPSGTTYVGPDGALRRKP